MKNERGDCGGKAAGALLSAAAALAFYRLTLARDGSGDGSLETGEVKVARNPGAVSSARRLWRETLASAAAYLKDDGFLFERTAP